MKFKFYSNPKVIVIAVIVIILSIVAYRYSKREPIPYKDYTNIRVYEKGSKEFKDGDIIFQTSLSNQSKAIQLATKSKYSHVGILYMKDQKMYVLEAVQPVKLTPLDEWINRGENGSYVVKRLKNADSILTPSVLTKMKQVADRFIGKDYDIYFGWSDEAIYCSELVWKIYKEGANIETGKLEKLKDFDLSDPFVKQIISERFGTKIPYDETVISPVSIFNSANLVTVGEVK